MSRVELEKISESERGEMDALMDSVLAVIDGKQRGLAISVMSQVLVGHLGDAEKLNDEIFLARTVAILGLLNIMRDGVADREYDQAGFAECVHDLSSIVTCGSRAIVIPSLASVLVAAVANGARDTVAEEAVVSEIRESLKRFEAALGSVS